MKYSIQNYYGIKCIIEKNNFKEILFEDIKNLKLGKFYFGHCVYTEFSKQAEKDIKKFVILRDPIQQFISTYFYFRNFRNKKNILNKNKFMDLLEFSKFTKLKSSDNLLTRFFSNNNKKLPGANAATQDIGKANSKNHQVTLRDFLIARKNLEKINIIFLEERERALIEIFKVPRSFHSKLRNKSKKINNNFINRQIVQNLMSDMFWDMKLYNYLKKKNYKNSI